MSTVTCIGITGVPFIANNQCPPGSQQVGAPGQPSTGGGTPGTVNPSSSGGPTAQSVASDVGSAVGSALSDLVPDTLKSPTFWKGFGIVAIGVLLVILGAAAWIGGSVLTEFRHGG